MPHWTTIGSWTLGLDPLGVQATSIRIYQSLVPGITNITNRLRYYAFYPWLVQQYERLHHSGDRDRFGRFMRRGEALFALATVVADTGLSDGLGGSNWANARRQAAAINGIDLRPFTDDPRSSDSYFQAAHGNFGGAYAPMLADLGILTRSTVPTVTDSHGRALADAFATSIGHVTALIEATIEKGTATAEDLVEIGHAVHPAAIPAGSTEMSQLRQFLLAGWEDELGAQPRRATAWLLLDLYRQGISIGDDDALRDAFYERRLPDGTRYDQQGPVIDRWRAYQANEYCHIALESLLNGLVGLQRDAYPDGREPRRLCAELAAMALSEAVSSWADWALEDGVAYAGAEDQLGRSIRASIRTGTRPAASVLMDAATLLAVLWSRWTDGDGDVRGIVARAAGRGGRSLAGVMETIDLHAGEPVGDVLAAVIHRHVVSDHLAIAGRKLSAGGTFTYHFTVEDGLLRDGEYDRYGYTNPRLSNLTRFLRDAGLVDARGLTADGEAFLAENQPF